MKRPRTAPDGTRVARRRKHRRRTTPRWLESSRDLEATARSRCLMVLSVLSGETPVSDAIRQAKISRGTYYKLETRALRGMLGALNPLASSEENGSAQLSAAALSRLGELQAKVERLEADKRRADRLLMLMRKAMRLAPIASKRGRRPKAPLHALISRGRQPSKRSKEKATPSPTSTPTAIGGSGPSPGSESLPGRAP